MIALAFSVCVETPEIYILQRGYKNEYQQPGIKTDTAGTPFEPGSDGIYYADKF